MDVERSTQVLSALGSVPRLRIIASLEAEPTHVSELARRLGMSRPLLYQHLNRLEAAGLVKGSLENAGESRMKKHYWVIPFHFDISPGQIERLIDQEQKDKKL